MHDYKGYKLVEHGPISKAKLSRVGKTGKLSLSAEELKGKGHKTLFHPSNAKMIMAAKKKGKGCNVSLSGGEIMNDMEYNTGGSVWSWIKEKAWPWLKTNVLPVAADVAAEYIGAQTGRPDLAATGRQVLKKVTGIGIAEQRLANLAKARAAKAAKKKNGAGLYL